MQKRNITRTTLLLAALLIFINLSAQNVGIGTNEPIEKLQVNGNLLIQQPYTFTNTTPTVAQTKTMVNGSTVTFLESDSTGRIYDPGGPTGNYHGNETATATIPGAFNNYGIEINVEDINLNSFDSVIITDYTGEIVFKVGNVYNTISKTIYNTSSLTIRFKSNSDGQTGRGFDISFKRLYTTAATPNLNSAFGNVVYFDASNGVFRSGHLSSAQKGRLSTAMGSNTEASGAFSTAMGSNTKASGHSSTAMGAGVIASGNYSIAMGLNTEAGSHSSTAIGSFSEATAYSSTAIGSFTIASGDYSTAIGFGTEANGDFSTAMGTSTSANGSYSFAAGSKVTAAQQGSFFFGDSDPDNEGVTANGSTDEFVCRFNNGYYFMTSGGNNNDGTPRTGVRVLPGGNSWSAVSDVRLKENFETVDGESFLHKIGAMPQYTWNYKGQNALTYRHYGPMAQDFYKAFGKDKYGSIGCDTLINQQDFLGVNLVAIQALVKRTEMLINKTEALNKKTQILSKENAALKQEIAMLKKKSDPPNDDKKGIVVLKKIGVSKNYANEKN